MGKYLFFIIQLLFLFGCKVQSDVPNPEESSLSSGSVFSYYLNDVTLNQNSNPIMLEHNLAGTFSYTITPGLPFGLALNSSTGKISGTPLGVIARTNFNVIATNPNKTLSTTIAIEVTPQAPGSIFYSTSPVIFNLGVAGTSGAPTTTGGTPTHFAIAATNPSGMSLASLGLSFNSLTGAISGTPNQPIQQWMTLSAINGGGTTQTQILLVVKDNAPTGVTYAGSPFVFNVGSAASILAPTVSGGVHAATFSVSPNLPIGLTLNTATGAITGTPTTSTGNVTYTLTATNPEGSAQTQIDIDINNPTLSITYGTSIDVYKNTSIGLLSPLYTGGKPLTYTVTAQTRPGAEVNDLVSAAGGLSLNNTTGRLTGAPQTILTEGSYTVTIEAQGDGGTPVSTTITFVVRPEPTIALNYPIENSFYINQAITTIAPNPTGGSDLTYAITPDISLYSGLPSGLSFNTANGQITGTPTLLMPETTYTVTATNSDLQTVNQSFVIEVKDLAPNYLGYEDFITNNPASYNFTAGRLLLTQGVTVPTITPEVNSRTVGVPTSYVVSPPLPNGLVFNALNGEISGVPTSVVENRSYSIQGTNSAGSFTEILIIEVRPGVPTSISYDNTGDGVNQFILTVNEDISPAEGAATVEPNPAIVPMSFTVSPAFPSGVSLNPTNGNITATNPLATVNPTTNYTITASGAGGSTSQTVQLTITNTLLGAGAIDYLDASAVAGIAGETIIVQKNVDQELIPSTPNYMAGTGGQVLYWELAGTLPPGLSFSSTTGIISGTPTVESMPGEYSFSYIYASSPGTYSFTVTGYNTPDNSGDSETYAFNLIVSAETPDYYFLSPDTNSTRMIAAAGQSENIVELGVSLFTNTDVVSSTNSGASFAGCYDLTPALPGYLTLESSTCRIYPTTPALMCGIDSEVNYTMSFRNSGGEQLNVPFSILVADAPGVYVPNREATPGFEIHNLQVFEGSNPTLLTMSPDFGACGATSGDSYILNSTPLQGFAFSTSTGNLTSNTGMAVRSSIDITGSRTVSGNVINKNSQFYSQTNYYNTDTSTLQQTIVFDFNKDQKEDIVIFTADDISYVKQNHGGTFTRDTSMNSYVAGLVSGGNTLYGAAPMVYANTGSAANHDKGVFFLTSSAASTYYLHGVSANNGSDNGFSSVITSTATPILRSKDMSLYGSSSYASAAYVAYKTASNAEIKVFSPSYSSGLVITEEETITINTSSIPANATLRDMAIFDNNGDGYFDIALAYTSPTTNGVCILRTSGSQFSHATVCETILTEVNQVPHQIAVANIANPLYNREDLVVLNYDSISSTYYAHVYENDNNFFTLNFSPVFSTDTGLATLDLSNGKDFFVADHNNDGDSELYFYDNLTNNMIRYENIGVAPWLSHTAIESSTDIYGVSLLKYQSTTGQTRHINSTPIYNSVGVKIGQALIHCELSGTRSSCGLPSLLSNFNDI